MPDMHVLEALILQSAENNKTANWSCIIFGVNSIYTFQKRGGSSSRPRPPSDRFYNKIISKLYRNL